MILHIFAEKRSANLMLTLIFVIWETKNGISYNLTEKIFLIENMKNDVSYIHVQQ